MRVLMVCLGNICRSPLAEGILRHKVKEKGLDWHIDSAGTSGAHGDEPADPRSVAIAQLHGIDISGHKGMKFSPYHFEEYDLIFVMDRYNYEDVMRKATSMEEEAKVRLILNEVNPGTNRDVPDPYYDSNGFEKVYKMLDEACTIIVEKALQNTLITP